MFVNKTCAGPLSRDGKKLQHDRTFDKGGRVEGIAVSEKSTVS